MQPQTLDVPPPPHVCGEVHGAEQAQLLPQLSVFVPLHWIPHREEQEAAGVQQTPAVPHSCGEMHGLPAQLTVPPQPSEAVPAHWSPQAAATVLRVQQVVPKEHDVLQQPEQAAELLTTSPSGTHAAVQCFAVTSHVPVVQTLAVQVTVLPQLSVTVPAHWVPQAAATVSEVQHVVPVEQEVAQHPPQCAVLSVLSPPGTQATHALAVVSQTAPVQFAFEVHCTHTPVVVLQPPTHVFFVQSSVLPQLSMTVPVHFVPQATARDSETHPHVVPELHVPVQHWLHSVVALTLSPLGMHDVEQNRVVSSHVPLVQTLAVQVSVFPQLSVTVPAHCVLQAAAIDSETHPSATSSITSAGGASVTAWSFVRASPLPSMPASGWWPSVVLSLAPSRIVVPSAPPSTVWSPTPRMALHPMSTNTPGRRGQRARITTCLSPEGRRDRSPPARSYPWSSAR